MSSKPKDFRHTLVASDDGRTTPSKDKDGNPVSNGAKTTVENREGLRGWKTEQARADRLAELKPLVDRVVAVLRSLPKTQLEVLLGLYCDPAPKAGRRVAGYTDAADNSEAKLSRLQATMLRLKIQAHKTIRSHEKKALEKLAANAQDVHSMFHRVASRRKGFHLPEADTEYQDDRDVLRLVSDELRGSAPRKQSAGPDHSDAKKTAKLAETSRRLRASNARRAVALVWQEEQDLRAEVASLFRMVDARAGIAPDGSSVKMAKAVKKMSVAKLQFYKDLLSVARESYRESDQNQQRGKLLGQLHGNPRYYTPDVAFEPRVVQWGRVRLIAAGKIQPHEASSFDRAYIDPGTGRVRLTNSPEEGARLRELEVPMPVKAKPKKAKRRLKQE